MELITRLKEYEGTVAYQKKVGYFKNNRFIVYKDSLGFNTIGYGHLVLPGEKFTNGISEDEANALLEKDIKKAKDGLYSLGMGYLEKDIEDYLIIMIFQLGLGGTRMFKRLLAAARKGDREGIIRESKDSVWYRQTPNRVNDMNRQLSKGH
jgi:lysozyme